MEKGQSTCPVCRQVDPHVQESIYQDGWLARQQRLIQEQNRAHSAYLQENFLRVLRDHTNRERLYMDSIPHWREDAGEELIVRRWSEHTHPATGRVIHPKVWIAEMEQILNSMIQLKREIDTEHSTQSIDDDIYTHITHVYCFAMLPASEGYAT